MKYSIVLFALCIAVTQAYTLRDRKDPNLTAAQAGGRIFYGKPAVNGQFPHMVFTSVGCGGGLISDKWVLSAAHCYTFKENDTINFPKEVFMGDVHWAMSTVHEKVADIYIHPRWDWKDFGYDIILLELENAVQFSETVQPIRIPSSRDELFDGELALLSGYGLIENLQYPFILYFVEQRVITTEECQKYHSNLGENMICTVGHPTEIQSACYGDSGSPLIVKRPEGDLFIGIVSHGSKECDGTVPTAYVKPHFLLDWIRKTTGLDNI